MFDLLWNLHQQSALSSVKADAARAERETRTQADRVRELEFALQRVTLVSQALWELLRSRMGITEDELLAVIREIDLRDGKLDGRMSPHATACPECQRNVNASRNARCIYCGAELPRPHVFQ